MQPQFFRAVILSAMGLLCASAVQAALFEDDEARKAILDLRQRVEIIRVDAEQTKKVATNEVATLTRSLLDLQRQLELLRADLAIMRGLSETQSKDLITLQKNQTDQLTQLSDRISKFEPVKVSIDGVEFVADPPERRDFESALGLFKKGDFSAAQLLFSAFVSRYPNSVYVASALFWLGNAQYATRDYKEAITNFRALIARKPDHMRVPEAVLSVANCQLELKDVKGARKTLSDLIRAYPDTEAASAAKERLAALK